MLLDVPHAVMGEVAHQHLPPQVQDFIHHVPKPVEQIPLILLWRQENSGKGGGEGKESIGMNEREIDKKGRQNDDTDKEMKTHTVATQR